MAKIILRIVGLYGKSLDYANGDGKHRLWMNNQSEHTVIRSHLTAEHTPKADKALTIR